ncbi:MAG TPA: HAD-IIA family hydrolase [Acidimicrobiia bacterium]|nr:HAD-IIA family hydrolase [Acidimicrobiia bacterium]
MIRQPAPAGTVVFDLDGVLYLDSEGVPGARDALEACVEAGWRPLYATNNSTKTADIVVRHIFERTGFRADPRSAVTSAMSAARHVASIGRDALVVGSDAIEHELLARGVLIVDHDSSLSARPDAVVVGLDRAISYERIDRAARAIRAGSSFVATNIDTTYPTPSGLAPGAGTIVAAIAAASGVDPVDCGKPTAHFGSLIVDMIEPGSVVVVGDRPETDIALGIAYGWTTVLVLTGVTSVLDDLSTSHTPDHVIDSVADLPALLANIGG